MVPFSGLLLFAGAPAGEFGIAVAGGARLLGASSVWTWVIATERLAATRPRRVVPPSDREALRTREVSAPLGARRIRAVPDPADPLEGAVGAVVLHVVPILEVVPAVAHGPLAGEEVAPTALPTAATPLSVGSETACEDVAPPVNPVAPLIVGTEEKGAGVREVARVSAASGAGLLGGCLGIAVNPEDLERGAQ